MPTEKGYRGKAKRYVPFSFSPIASNRPRYLVVLFIREKGKLNLSMAHGDVDENSDTKSKTLITCGNSNIYAVKKLPLSRKS